MKIYITTDNGDLVNSMKHIEQYDMDKSIARSDIISFVVEAQKSAKWFCDRSDSEMLFNETEKKWLRGKP